jgi:hypothetical protein
MRIRVAHAPWSAQSDATRRTGLSVNPQFITYHPRNSVQTTGATPFASFPKARSAKCCFER